MDNKERLEIIKELEELWKTFDESGTDTAWWYCNKLDDVIEKLKIVNFRE